MSFDVWKPSNTASVLYTYFDASAGYFILNKVQMTSLVFKLTYAPLGFSRAEIILFQNYRTAGRRWTTRDTECTISSEC